MLYVTFEFTCHLSRHMSGVRHTREPNLVGAAAAASPVLHHLLCGAMLGVALWWWLQHTVACAA